MVIMKKLWRPLLAVWLISTTSWAVADDEQDPWQGYNRAMYSFNHAVDKYTLKPLAKGYVYVTPPVVRKGVSNVFSNIGEVPSAINGILQAKPGKAARNTGRFLINSTIGLLGIFDVASHMGLAGEDKEDFGQTLATWGVGQGPYLVLPFLGPSTLRDTFALPAAWYTDPRVYIDDTSWEVGLLALGLVDTRASLLDLEQHLTGDHYVFIRDAYLQRRNFLIQDGMVTDEFGMDDDLDDFDFDGE